MSRVGNFLTNIWSEKRLEQSTQVTAKLGDINPSYENFEPYSLGVYYSEKLQRRERKSIYTNYKLMMQDPTIHACLNLLVTAALGGHETRGEVVFIRASEKVKTDGTRARELRAMVEKEAEHLQGLINSVIFAFARNGIGYGDSFARGGTEHHGGLFSPFSCNFI